MDRKFNVITGHKGFVGSNLVKYLNNEHNIIGVSRNPSNTELSYSDLTKEKLSRSKSLIHLAGIAHDLKSNSKISDYFAVNTDLTKKVFNNFLHSDCEVFIYLSSVKAVADKVDGILKEDEPPNPLTAYGKSKLAAENYILSKNIPKNKRVYILRPCMIHGPNNKGNLNLLYSFILKRIPYPFGKYHNRRSFVSVENLCFIIKELIDNDKIEPGVYHISDDIPLSSLDIVQVISEVTGKPIMVLKLPKFFIKIIAKVGDFFSLPINSERLLKLTENYEVSNSKITRAINKKLPFSSIDGLKKTILSFES
ncbi:NAD-dependent epimerase/dehydratase family protein [Flavobacteriaceae bacterium]|nr:NAD-dependent epimerase/dehydratase family protein [Flavobacteriaceae bacterium]